MPLPTSTYHISHSHLRADGRRWNELRHTVAQTRTQPAADGSAYLAMGNTQVRATVTGPAELRSMGGRGGGGQQQQGQQLYSTEPTTATVVVELSIAGFSGATGAGGGGGRRKGGGATAGADRRTAHLTALLTSTLQSSLLPNPLPPSSTIHLQLTCLSADGSLLAALINVSTLALIDAGIGMYDYVVGCSSGLVPNLPNSNGGGGSGGAGGGGGESGASPLLDLNSTEEQECQFLTIATRGGRVVVCEMEGRVQGREVEGMVAVGVGGCERIRGVLDGVVREGAGGG